jgi:hypothetical protein
VLLNGITESTIFHIPTPPDAYAVLLTAFTTATLYLSQLDLVAKTTQPCQRVSHYQ